MWDEFVFGGGWTCRGRLSRSVGAWYHAIFRGYRGGFVLGFVDVGGCGEVIGGVEDKAKKNHQVELVVFLTPTGIEPVLPT